MNNNDIINQKESILKDVTKIIKKYGYEIINDDVIKILDIRTFDEVVEDNLNYWEVGNLPIEYIDKETMVDNDNDYEKVGNMYWKTLFIEDDLNDLKELNYIKKK